MIEKRKVWVAGASGLIGGQLLHVLQEREYYENVLALGRREGGIEGKIRWHKVDYDAIMVPEEVDDIYCALGTTIKKAGSKDAFYKVDHDYVINVAREGLLRGAKRFALVSSVGADKGAMAFYLRVKGEVEEDLKALGYKEVHIFRPSLLLGDRKEYRLGEKVGEWVLKLARPILVGSLRKQRPVQAAKVAETMVIKMTQPSKSSVTVHSVHG